MTIGSPRPQGTSRLEYRRLAPIILVVVAIALGVLYRFSTLAKDSLNCDELYSWATIQLKMVRVAFENFDVHPPLFYLFLKIASILGQSEFFLRLPSALFGLCTAVLVYHFVKSRLDRRSAVIAALCLLFSFKNIVYSSLSRNYALEVLLCFAASWVLTLLCEDLVAGRPSVRRQLRLGTVYAALSAGALLTHSMAAIYLIVLNSIVFVVYGVARLKATPKLAGIQAAINAPGFALFTIWYLAASKNSGDFEWLEKFSPVRAFEIFLAAWAPTGLPLPIVLLAALLVLIGFGLSLVKTPRSFVVVEATLFIAVPVSLWLISLAKPVFMERTIIFAAPGASLAIAALVSKLRWRSAGLILGVGLIFAYMASSTLYVRRGVERDSYGMEPIQDFRRALDLADADLTPRSALLSCEGFTEPAFRYYGVKPKVEHLVLDQDKALGDLTGRWADFYGRPAPVRALPGWIKPDQNALAPLNRVVFVDVTNFCGAQGGRPEQLLMSAGFKPTSKTHVQGIDIRVFDRAAPAQTVPTAATSKS